MDVEAKTRFQKACQAAGLDAETTTRSWELLRDLALNPDDPTTIVLAVSGRLEMLARALPAQLEEATRKGTAAVATAAKSAIAVAQAQSKASQDATVATVGKEIAATVDKAVARRAQAFDRSTLAAAVLAFSLGLLAAFGGGWAFGRSQSVEVAGAIGARLTASDGRTWSTLMANNDVAAAIAEYCRPGSRNVNIIDGGKACNVPLWLERSATAPGGAVSVAPAAGQLPELATAWLAGLNPWWLLVAGLLAGTFARKLVRSVLRFPPLAWLLDVGPRQAERP